MLLHRVAVAEDKMYFAGFFVHIQRRFSKGELFICVRVLMTPSLPCCVGFDCGGLGCYLAYCGVIKHPSSKAGVNNPTHKTPHNGTTPPLKGARLDHFVMDNAFKTSRLFRYEGG
jgi:hypothetical protein